LKLALIKFSLHTSQIKSIHDHAEGVFFVVALIQRRFHPTIAIPPFEYRCQGQTQDWGVDREGGIMDWNGGTVGNYSITRVYITGEMTSGE
jgi:hypothetical protein